MKRFFNLKFGDRLIVDGVLYQKENFFSAVRCYGLRSFSTYAAPLYRRFWPWTKVQNNLPLYLHPEYPVFSSPPPLGERVRTHHFGDSCYPPHEPFKDDNRSGPSA